MKSIQLSSPQQQRVPYARCDVVSNFRVFADPDTPSVRQILDGAVDPNNPTGASKGTDGHVAERCPVTQL
ncbi:hypothetical protein ACX80S_19160 [Arthrobacter sp. RHLT1-20]